MKHVTLAGELKEFVTAARLLVVHAEQGWVESVSNGQFDFFTRLAPRLEEEGVAQVVVTLDTPLSNAMLAQNHLHLIFGNRPQYRSNALHVSPAYVWGFWYLDEIGINAHSSMRIRKFGPHDVDWGHAEWFFNGVTSHMLNNNVSRHPQTERAPYSLDHARAVIFCQDIEDRAPREHYLTIEEIVRNTARAAQGGRVYVKVHPGQTDAMRDRLARAITVDPCIQMSDASVHDLIQASSWVVTQNSAAGFEALMQRKPVITCAKSDYHHATLVARNEQELRELIRGDKRHLEGFEYEKYFYWFLSEHCVEPQREDFPDVVWNRLRDKAMI